MENLYRVKVMIQESRQVEDYIEICKQQFGTSNARKPEDKLLLIKSMSNYDLSKNSLDEVHGAICGFTRGKVTHVCTQETFEECMTRFYNMVPEAEDYFSFISADKSILFTPLDVMPFSTAIIDRWTVMMDYSTSWKIHFNDTIESITTHRQVTFGAEENINYHEIIIGHTSNEECEKILKSVSKIIEPNSDKIFSGVLPFVYVKAGIKKGDTLHLQCGPILHEIYAKTDMYPTRIRFGRYDWSLDIVFPWKKAYDETTGEEAWELANGRFQPSLKAFLRDLPSAPMGFRVSHDLAYFEDFISHVFEFEIKFNSYLNLDYLSVFCGVLHPHTNLTVMNLLLTGGFVYTSEWIPTEHAKFSVPLEELTATLNLFLTGSLWAIMNCYITLKLCLLSQMFPTPGFMFRLSGLSPEDFLIWYNKMFDLTTMNDCRKMLATMGLVENDVLPPGRVMMLTGRDIRHGLELEFILRNRPVNKVFRDSLKKPAFIHSPSVAYGGPRCVERLLPVMMDMVDIFCKPLPGSDLAWEKMPAERRLTLSWFGRKRVPDCNGDEMLSSPKIVRCQELPAMKDLPTKAMVNYKSLKAELDLSDKRSEMQVLMENAFYQPEYFKVFLDRLCLPKENPLAIGFLELRKKNNLTKIVGASFGIDPTSWDRPEQERERFLLTLSGMWRALENELTKLDPVSQNPKIIEERKELEEVLGMVKKKTAEFGLTGPVSKSKNGGIMTGRRLLPCDRHLLENLDVDSSSESEAECKVVMLEDPDDEMADEAIEKFPEERSVVFIENENQLEEDVNTNTSEDGVEEVEKMNKEEDDHLYVLEVNLDDSELGLYSPLGPDE